MQVEQYQSLIASLANQLFVKYGGTNNQLLFGCLSREDLEQSGRMGCLMALRSYKNTHNTKLVTYVHVLVFRELRRVIRQCAKHHQNTVTQPCERVLAAHDEDFWEWIPNTLTDKERLVLEMRLANYTLKEIGKELSVSYERARIILEDIYEKIRVASA